MTFETVSEATRLWIKGRDFSVARLLGDTYKGQAEKYNGGALAIFRLAPQDYHRFHSPVDGKIGPMTFISGEYYTVNVCVFLKNLNLSDSDLKLWDIPAASYSYLLGCVWRERTQNCTY
jgi:phosphatidylserine decarboxylase